ncbi:galactose oxidase-like domain-containing protein [Nitrosomonas sp. Nm166]|uniref:galactose oxidase-like domain-containing protein n=1 Tax=Nitrosomonas sp. Nm166 TaxID=1881054 RepID=UPI0008E521C6|nr:galactose oxidase-like domain-containing protein [Nitrosomonas sp. Nm166]SFE23032.1 Multicopper oxidase with three cupredoxin domains (includes cell division protein FtsP and spore coat protein CotA) [Nitrosomonas sp. Nm166]
MRYDIRGRVIDSFTGDGIGGVRVEVWDKDFILDDYLGSASTVTDGSFSISFEDSAFHDLFFDRWPDLYFRVYCYNELLASTESSVLWNIRNPQTGVTIHAAHPKPLACDERHIYLKIERIEHYSPVRPQEKVVPPVQYGRDCMRGDGHENGLIPQTEIDARALTAVVYRAYLDSGYLIPKPDKLIAADINEPVYTHRVPGTVIYTRPCQRLKIHVWNTDDVPHSLHMHGLRYGIDSDGSWPFGTQAAHHGSRSDAICPGQTWIYTFDVPDNTLGAWPFHDHTYHHDTKIDQGLFAGVVVLGACDRPPRHFRFPWEVLRPIYLDIERFERSPVFLDKEIPELFEFDEETVIQLAPYIHAQRLKDETRLILKQRLDFLEEFTLKELALPRRVINTDHVPVFLHVMSNPEAKPVFDTDDIEELGGEAEIVFNTAGDYDYFCRHHPEMTGIVHVVPGGPDPVTVTIAAGPPMVFSPDEVTVGVGGTVKWINNSNAHHTVTSAQGASMPTHCINGRGFTGNTPTIVGRSGQRIRWYVFNLDTSPTWHNFHPHAMRWKFGGEYLDVRSLGPAESFIVESEIPPVLLLTAEEEKAQLPEHRPPGATLHQLKGDFLFHCHVHHHMMNGMVGLVRARQSLWLTEDMAHEISHRTGLPLDDGSNACPDVNPHPCRGHGGGRWEEVPGAPEVAFMHSVLLPNTQRVLYWGYTRADQSRVWDYSTLAGSYLLPANQPADSPGLDINTSNLWSAEHTILDTAAGTLLIHGGFSPNKAFTFDPASLTWTRVADTVGDRFYATTLILADGRAVTLYGNVKTIEIYTHGAGWAAPIAMPASMNHHQYYPWTYLLPDGRLFIAGPHDPTHRIDLAVPGAPEAFSTINGDRSTGGEKGSSVLFILRPPAYQPIACIMGGNPAAAQKTVEMIDLSAPVPAWTALPDFNIPRAEQFTATLLPDGRIFVAGGVSGGPDGGVCEIFDPRDPGAGWVMGPAMKYVRTYHSSFILLADGSVLAGGDPQSNGAPTPHERFFPDYFDMLRPVISNAPATVNYGASFNIATPNAADITEVVLLRAGAVTHGFNMSQRGLECVVSGIGAGVLTVDMPANTNLAPPGWYLLFILNASRVPSMGQWVRVTT